MTTAGRHAEKVYSMYRLKMLLKNSWKNADRAKNPASSAARDSFTSSSWVWKSIANSINLCLFGSFVSSRTGTVFVVV